MQQVVFYFHPDANTLLIKYQQKCANRGHWLSTATTKLKPQYRKNAGISSIKIIM